MSLDYKGKHCEARRAIAGSPETVLWGGSGSGKSYLISDVLIGRALLIPGSIHGLMRVKFDHIKKSLWPMVKSVMDMAYPGLWKACGQNKSAGTWTLTFPNGSEFWFGGLGATDEALEKWLSTEFASIYINEISQVSKYADIAIMKTRLRQKLPEGCTYKLLLDMNPPTKKHWTYKHLQDLKGVPAIKLNPRDNAHNLPQSYLDTLKTLPPKQRKRFWDGDFTEDNEKALWGWDEIQATRVPAAPDMRKIVVGVDPQGKKGPDTDDTGLVVVGLGLDKHGYVLEDKTGDYSPNEWARHACELYHKWQAAEVVAEINMGWDLVESNIMTYDPSVKLKKVVASRNKKARAEPVEALYERHMIHHVGNYPELESEMTEWNPDDPTEASPNRLDALVWACTHLMVGKRESILFATV